ncbi:tRNA lysidine(34) synthetase TilS [Sphingomonas lenta]|uniref:tRNA(Ile)-lysidine synthase n=1 Tax=Sphingomonas lenta TaxID=1141887 RepID=A0A2A2SFT7_9SPHN|nr:tRNA lysidine(34) synthetase TilS [Sphingomonas lenta]PAX08117.1 tRNA lysidine(34) synthetase TilS [Sphingomonas lenta]
MTDPDAARFLSDLTRALGRAPAGVIGLAVSGGPDSMAMLALAHEALDGRVAAATVNHGLRPEADEEAALVAARCAELGVPHATLRPEEPITGGSVQAQARERRYTLLGRWAAAQGAEAVATAHHADDQAETFLMRAARGSGLSGLAGVRARAVIAGVTVVRPLLDWRRAELRAIARRREMPFVDDPSNQDLRYDRARARKLLDEHEWLGPANIARSAAYLAEADGDLRATVDWLWAARATVTGDDVRVDAAELPREVRRRLARRAVAVVREAAGIAEPEFTDATNVEALLDGLEGGKRVTQSGVLASVRDGRWRLRPAPPRKS